MGNFFDDLGNAFKKLADDVSTEVSVTAKQQKAKEEFQKLGRMYYQTACKGTEPVGVAFDKQVALIRELLQQINDLKNKVDIASADDFAD
jgi:hypothetical protein